MHVMSIRAKTQRKRARSSLLTIRLAPGVKARVEQLAEATDRTSTWVVHDALVKYLDANEWQVKSIREAVANADAHPEDFVEHREVEAWLRSWGRRRERKPPL
jgi:predicted transcriptional regulator